MIGNFGWQTALTVFACLMLLIVPLSFALATPPAAPVKVARVMYWAAFPIRVGENLDIEDRNSGH